MTENISGIPVVDFSAMSLKHKDPLKENAEAVKELADQVYQAFTTIGFVYLKNHGIPQEVASTYMHTYINYIFSSSLPCMTIYDLTCS